MHSAKMQGRIISMLVIPYPVTVATATVVSRLNMNLISIRTISFITFYRFLFKNIHKLTCCKLRTKL